MQGIRICYKKIVPRLVVFSVLLTLLILIVWVFCDTSSREMRIFLALTFALLSTFITGVFVFRKLINPLIRNLEDECDLRLKLSIAIEQSPDSVVITDINGLITYVNPAYERVTGYNSDEVIGMSPGFLKSGMTSSEVYKTLWSNILSGEVWRGELQNRKKNGKLFWEDTTIAPIKSNNGLTIAYVAVKKDVTNQREDARALKHINTHLDDLVQERTIELQCALRSAETANKAKSEFLANMSHELRSPLHLIQNFAHMTSTELLGLKERLKLLGGLKNCNLNLESMTLIDLLDNPLSWQLSVKNQQKRLLDHVNGLLDLAKMESGKMSFHFSEANLYKLVKQEVNGLRSLIDKNEINLQIVSTDLSMKLSCDKDKLRQVLLNLFTNAIKFSNKKGSTIKVSFDKSTLNGENAIVLEISDEGCGIPESELDVIFEPFIQSTMTENGSGGTGLGLPISRKIIEAHSGTITASNNQNVGSTFTIVLPKKQN